MGTCAPYFEIMDTTAGTSTIIYLNMFSWDELAQRLYEALTKAANESEATQIQIKRVCKNCKTSVTYWEYRLSWPIARDAALEQFRGTARKDIFVAIDRLVTKITQQALLQIYEQMDLKNRISAIIAAALLRSGISEIHGLLGGQALADDPICRN